MLENLPITVLDIIALVIILVSAVFAAARGFVHEVLFIGAIIGAILVTLYGYEHVLPFAEQLTDIVILQKFGTGLVLFLVSLVGFWLFSHSISKHVKDSALGPLDRALGFLFGIARGVIILCIVYVATTFIIEEKNMPDVATQSRGYPYVVQVTDTIVSFLPDYVQERYENATDRSLDAIEDTRQLIELKERLNNPAPSGTNQPQDQSGYSQDDRNQLDELIRDSE